MYKKYYFDFYDTLVDVELEEVNEELWEKLSLYFSYFGADYNSFDLEKKFRKTENKLINLNKKTDYPEMDIIDIFFKIFKDKDLKLKKWMPKESAKLYRLLTTKKIKLRKNVVETLKAIKNNGSEIYLYANGQKTFIEAEMKAFNIKKYFEHIYVSSDFGMKIEDEQFFLNLIEETSPKKKDSLFISGNKENYVAEKLGYKTAYIVNNQEEVDEDNRCIAERDFLKILEM